MNWLTTLITGGFLKGYRSHILGFLLFAQAVASWTLGDMTLDELVKQLPELVAGLGIMSLRSAIAGVKAAVTGDKP